MLARNISLLQGFLCLCLSSVSVAATDEDFDIAIRRWPSGVTSEGVDAAVHKRIHGEAKRR